MAIIKLETVAPKFIISEIQSSDTENCIPCVFNSQEVTVIRQALFPIAYWRTRLGENIGGKLFQYTEDEAIKTEFRDIVDLIDYKLSGGDLMDCFESIGQGLSDIAASLALLAQNQAACGVVSNPDCPDITVTTGGNSTSVDTDAGPGEDENVGTPPQGYESWEDYFNGKCAAASFIVNGVVAVLNAFAQQQALMGVAVCAAILVSILSINLPAFAIATLVGVVVFLEASVLTSVASAIDARKSEVVCALYNSKTVGGALDDVMEVIDDILLGLSLSIPAKGQVRAALVILFSESAAAKLFSFVGAFLPSGDCASCVEEELALIDLTGTKGNVVSDTIVNGIRTIVIDAEPQPQYGNYVLNRYYQFFTPDEPNDIGFECTDVSLTSGEPQWAVISKRRKSDGVLMEEGTDLTYLENDCIVYLVMASTGNTPFQITLTMPNEETC